MGSTAEEPCKSCRGSGRVEIDRTVKVTFPAGIDDGQTLRVPGQGLAGTQGGPAGHLYVDVAIEPDPRFQREGSDLLHALDPELSRRPRSVPRPMCPASSPTSRSR